MRGASQFLQGLENGVTQVPMILETEGTLLPASLEITSSATNLNPSAPGSQLVATGTLPNGALIDLTLASTGTYYLSSNPAIATVSTDGFVDAVSSGGVLITATHQGVTATLRLDIQFSEDTDNDGLPDDFESLNSIDPGGSNLARRPDVLTAASSFSSGKSPDRVIDGELSTSWFTSDGDAVNQGSSPWIEVRLPQEMGVSQVRILGNRENAEGRDFLSGVVQGFAADGSERFDSGELVLPAPTRDLAIPVDLDGIQRVRFTATADESTSPGLAEIEILSRSGGLGLDPDDPNDGALDFDQDGLTNLEEFQQGTSLFNSDTDGDGLGDAMELALGLNPLLPDSDNDGLIDGREVSPGSDSDGDGLINGLDPDSDNDGLPDGVEVAIGLDPVDSDSDNDGLPDGSEDSDGDGLVNLDELFEGTDPGNSDTDGDGFPDGEELQQGTDPLDPLSFKLNVVAARPAASVIRVGVVEGEGQRNVVSAQPSVTLLSSEAVGVVEPNTSIARPSVSLITTGIPADAVLNTVSAKPDIELLLSSLGGGLIPNIVVAEPSATVLLSSVAGVVERNVVVARPRVRLLLSVAQLGELNVIVARPPVTVEIPSGAEAITAPGETQQDEEGETGKPVVITDGLPAPGDPLIEGETVRLAVVGPSETARVVFRANGATMAIDSVEPFEWTFTVPYRAQSLVLEVIAEDSQRRALARTSLTSTVEPDPGTTVHGRVLNADGSPLQGATVEVLLAGLRTELFFLDASRRPDGTSRLGEPDLTRQVSAVNFRNPENRLSPDTFGTGRTTDLMARFTGFIEVASPGEYELVLGADDAASLSIDKKNVLSVDGDGAFARARGSVHLEPGPARVELELYQAVGASELQLAIRAPGAAEAEILDTLLLLPTGTRWTTTTDNNGFFSIEGVATTLGEIWIRGTSQEASVLEAVIPVRGGLADFGDLQLED